MTERLTALVSGTVQGVGFRAWVRRRAVPHGVTGSAINLPDGRVQVVAEGPRDVLEVLLADLRGAATPGIVTDVAESWDAPRGATGFRLG